MPTQQLSPKSEEGQSMKRNLFFPDTFQVARMVKQCRVAPGAQWINRLVCQNKAPHWTYCLGCWSVLEQDIKSPAAARLLTSCSRHRWIQAVAKGCMKLLYQWLSQRFSFQFHTDILISLIQIFLKIVINQNSFFHLINFLLFTFKSNG